MKKLIIYMSLFFSFFAKANLPTIVKEIKHSKPAFLKVFNTPSKSMYVSTFKFFGGDNIKEYKNLEQIINKGKVDQRLITNKITWPNEIENYPGQIDNNKYFVIASGFFPPTKNLGGIYLLNKTTHQLTKITKDKKGWWYHRTRFWDYDGDGIKDIVTARALKGFTNKKGAELIALLAPNNQGREQWQEKVLFKGPDVFFELIDLNNDGKFEVIASQYLHKKITLHHTINTNQKWEEVIIDDQIGEGFDVSIVDLNLDGNKDLLVTNHVNTNEAGVFAYEFPDNPSLGKWKKHIIHKGFTTTARGIGQASPGNAKAFIPYKNKQTRPSIVVSGDGNKNVHIFTPKKSAWEYQHDIIYKGKGIIGKVTTADADEDGKTEIYIPSYDGNKIIIMEY